VPCHYLRGKGQEGGGAGGGGGSSFNDGKKRVHIYFILFRLKEHLLTFAENRGFFKNVFRAIFSEAEFFFLIFLYFKRCEVYFSHV
jgi:hypothetical protein